MIIDPSRYEIISYFPSRNQSIATLDQKSTVKISNALLLFHLIESYHTKTRDLNAHTLLTQDTSYPRDNLFTLHSENLGFAKDKARVRLADAHHFIQRKICHGINTIMSLSALPYFRTAFQDRSLIMAGFPNRMCLGRILILFMSIASL